VVVLIGKHSFGIFLIHEIFRGKITSMLSDVSFLYCIQPLFQFCVVLITLGSCMSLVCASHNIIGRRMASKFLGF
jgi:hypothetical protein